MKFVIISLLFLITSCQVFRMPSRVKSRSESLKKFDKIVQTCAKTCYAKVELFLKEDKLTWKRKRDPSEPILKRVAIGENCKATSAQKLKSCIESKVKDSSIKIYVYMSSMSHENLVREYNKTKLKD